MTDAVVTKPFVCYFYGYSRATEDISSAIRNECKDKGWDNYYMSAGSYNRLCYSASSDPTSSTAIIELAFGCCAMPPDALLAILTNDKTSPHFQREHKYIFITGIRPIRDTLADNCNDPELMAKLIACIDKHEFFEVVHRRTAVPP